VRKRGGPPILTIAAEALPPDVELNPRVGRIELCRDAHRLDRIPVDFQGVPHVVHDLVNPRELELELLALAHGVHLSRLRRLNNGPAARLREWQQLERDAVDIHVLRLG